MARAGVQTVRTTAYTHTESDHVEYGPRNALGGRLQSASYPRGRVQLTPPKPRITAAPDSLIFSYQTRSRRSSKTKTVKAKRGRTQRSSKPKEPQIGSAAADWSRWPLGTTFQVLSTGQIYKVDDYGWALAGRNTIDLYMGSRSEMNRWGVRQEPIQILKWGDAERSIKVLELRQAHKHIRRMVLELQGQDNEAAALN